MSQFGLLLFTIILLKLSLYRNVLLDEFLSTSANYCDYLLVLRSFLFLLFLDCFLNNRLLGDSAGKVFHVGVEGHVELALEVFSLVFK